MTKQRMLLPVVCEAHLHAGYGPSKETSCPWCEIERLETRILGLTEQLLKVGGEMGKVQAHNNSLREALNRRVTAEPKPSQPGRWICKCGQENFPEDGECHRCDAARTVEPTSLQTEPDIMVHDSDVAYLGPAEPSAATCDHVSLETDLEINPDSVLITKQCPCCGMRGIRPKYFASRTTAGKP